MSLIGKFLPKKKCPRCKGKGTIKCRQCGGKGSKGFPFGVPCKICKETGELSCPNCKGSGGVER